MLRFGRFARAEWTWIYYGIEDEVRRSTYAHGPVELIAFSRRRGLIAGRRRHSTLWFVLAG